MVGQDHVFGNRNEQRRVHVFGLAALCGAGGDGAPYRSVGDFGTAIPVELGLGYTMTSTARLEVLVEYRPAFAFRGRANFLSPESRQSVAADLSSFAGMVAAYIDLPGAGVPKIGPFGRFVGAGLGVAHTRIGQTRMTFPATTTIVPGAGRTDLAWMVTAGVAAALGERVTVDLAWRYTDLGAAHRHGADEAFHALPDRPNNLSRISREGQRSRR